MARSACASSPPRKSSCRSSDVTDARSSSGSGSVSSHARPVFPNRSDTGGRGIRLRCSTACTRFLILVRCFTRCDRAVVIRRSIAVRSSGNQTGGKKSTASSCARILASTLSVLIFASAIARVFNGFDTTTRPAYCDNRPAIASLLPVASNATWSSTVSCAAHARSASGLQSTLPASITSSPSTIAICAKSRCTSIPMNLGITVLLPLVLKDGKGLSNRHLRIRAHGAAGQVARAATY